MWKLPNIFTGLLALVIVSSGKNSEFFAPDMWHVTRNSTVSQLPEGSKFVKPHWRPSHPVASQKSTVEHLPTGSNATIPKFFPVSSKFSVQLLVGNQASLEIEVYNILFTCKAQLCEASPVNRANRLWNSGAIRGLSEVKYVRYADQPAILATTTNGAKVLAYRSGQTLFHKEVDGYTTNVHSAEVLPDGNVIIVDSYGSVIILRNDSKVVNQPWKDTVSYQLDKPHGIYYDKKRDCVYVLAYSALHKYKYEKSGNQKEHLTLLKVVNLTLDYYPTDNENIYEGGHDLYPMSGSNDLLYVTTGEHVYQYNMISSTLTKDPSLYTIPSVHGRDPRVRVKNKGGVKAISRDPTTGITFVHPAPWFKIYDQSKDPNYSHSSKSLIWTMPGSNCEKPDIDLTLNCKIDFTGVEVKFYKARVLLIPNFAP